jgi:hypothetical protein
MLRRILYKNVQAGEQLELFLLSAAGSLLAVRFYLHVTGYPQIGGGGLHVAHMLWGGLLMLTAFVLMLSFLGRRVQRLGAILGGAGFGVFIDEIGKFITSDNNYFYRPAVGIIYAIFVILYLIFNFISQKQSLTSKEYQLNTLMQLEEAVLRDMDVQEKKEALRLIGLADQKSAITQRLAAFVENVDAIPVPRRAWPERLLRAADKAYEKFWRQRNSSRLIQGLFIVQIVVYTLAVIWPVYTNIDQVLDIFRSVTYGKMLLAGQLLSSLVAAGFVIYGAVVIMHDRRRALEQFRRALLINLLLTEFFIFSRVEFDALPGFALNAALLAVTSYALHRERQRARATF